MRASLVRFTVVICGRTGYCGKLILGKTKG